MPPLIGSGLRARLPSSRTRMFSRITLFDAVWAGISPLLAFVIRDGAIKQIDYVVVYSCVALVISIIVFQWFRISSPLSRFFSSHDAFMIFKACLTTVALTVVVLFVLTRLNYAPRSIPIIHFLVLTSGLIGSRGWKRLADTGPVPVSCRQPGHKEVESIIVVGATRLAWFFSTMVEEFSSHERRIVGVVDERPQLINRTLNGYSILGLPEDLPKIVDEYATHGIEVRKIVVAADPKDLTEKTRVKVQTICRAKNIPIEWLHETFLSSCGRSAGSLELAGEELSAAGAAKVRPYWKLKRVMDVVVALALMITCTPLAIVISALVLIDVGVPIVFWQQRIGYLGRPFHVYKFRTMRSCFDRKGRPIAETERLSLLGRLLRLNHVDEIPQLANILMGTMSLVGPRPLLPLDQPNEVGVRLQVRPGLTGLAQINGGISLSADEKSAIDEWYIEHASLILDVKIILRTIWVIIVGNPRNETLISMALAQKQQRFKGVYLNLTSTVEENQKSSKDLKDILAVRPASSKY